MAQRETGVPKEWESWYRGTKGKLSRDQLERARKIEHELNEMYPLASAEHVRVFNEAERLVQESNARLRARGSWSDRGLNKKGGKR